MDVIELARTVLRRWYVMVPVLMVTAGLAYTVASTAQTHYEATGSFLLTDASLVGGVADGAGGSATVTPQVLGEIVQGGAVRSRVREGGGTATYNVAADGGEGLLRFTAAGETEQAAVTTVLLLLEEAQRELDARQEEAGVPEQRRVIVEVLSQPDSAQQEVVDQGTDAEAVRFVASGSLRFVGAADQGSNPYAASLGGTVRVLEEVLASPQVRQEIAAEGGRGTYEVAMRARDTVPIIVVTAQSTSAQATMDTFGVVVDRLNRELRERQELAGAPSASMLTFQPLSMPVGVSVVGGELRRPLIVIVGLGLVAAVSLAVLVEGLATRLRPRRRGRDPLNPSNKDGLATDGQVREAQVSQPVPGR